MDANACTGTRGIGWTDSKVLGAYGRDELIDNGERQSIHVTDNKLALINTYYATPAREYRTSRRTMLVHSTSKGPEESTAAMLRRSELCEPHPTPMLSLPLSCLFELLIAQRQYQQIYKEEPVLSPSEADTPASLPSHLPGTTILPQMGIFLWPVDHDSAGYLTQSIVSYTETLLHHCNKVLGGGAQNYLIIHHTRCPDGRKCSYRHKRDRVDRQQGIGCIRT